MFAIFSVLLRYEKSIPPHKIVRKGQMILIWPLLFFAFSLCLCYHKYMNGAVVEARKESSLWYKVLLGILIVVVVGLATIVVVINNKKVNEPEEPSSGYDLPEGVTEDDLLDEDKVVLKAVAMMRDPNISMEEVEKYYDEVIDQANKDGEYAFAINVIKKKLLFLVMDEEDCDKAREYSSRIDDSMYSEDEKRSLELRIDSVMIDCKNEEGTDAK